uniref:Uncharacterized protein n=1 Tax=Anguilla anguilla TaxID=7936 RepID=A0A0E9QTF4_ANGAN
MYVRYSRIVTSQDVVMKESMAS